MIKLNTTLTDIQTKLAQHHEAISEWFKEKEATLVLPFYTSVDIRDSGSKIAIIDTNIFPAGFNNISPDHLKSNTKIVKEALDLVVENAKGVLIIAEEHTRNLWYLENVYALKTLIENAGYCVRVATFFDEHPMECDDGPYIALKTATGKE